MDRKGFLRCLKRSGAYLLVFVWMTSALAGCGKQEQLAGIGTEGTDDYSVKLTNATGQDILSVAVKEMDETEFPDNMLEEGDVFVAGEERMLFWAKEDEQEEKTAGDSEKLITQGWDIGITLADDSFYVLHSFPFEEITEGEICVEDGVAFVTYSCEGSMVSTKEAEITILEQEEAEAEAARIAEEEAEAEAARIAAEEAAAAEAAAQTQSSSTEQSTSSGSSSTEESSSSDTSSSTGVSQSSESCIGDEGLTY